MADACSTCTLDHATVCMDGYEDDGDANDITTCQLNASKCLSHECTVTDNVQISAAATTACADAGCADAECCIADPCMVADVCGDYQECALADDDTADCTCMDGYVVDADAATLTCVVDASKCDTHACTETDNVQISAAATTACADAGCADAECCEVGECEVPCLAQRGVAICFSSTTSYPHWETPTDNECSRVKTGVTCYDGSGDGDGSDACATERAACEADTACAACMTAADANLEGDTCTDTTADMDCEGHADHYCCMVGGEDDEDACRTDSLLVDFVNCMLEEEVESCTLVDLCDASATVAPTPTTVAPTPAPVTSGTSSFFSRSSPGAAVFGAVATGIAGFLFTAVEGLL
ncbi:unnamed protein product [Ectocarpus fasciculatus]